MIRPNQPAEGAIDSACPNMTRSPSATPSGLDSGRTITEVASSRITSPASGVPERRRISTLSPSRASEDRPLIRNVFPCTALTRPITRDMRKEESSARSAAMSCLCIACSNPGPANNF